MKTLLFLFFAANIFADTIVTTPRPKFLGGGTVSVVKDNSGKVKATAITVDRPKFLGGGTVTTIKEKNKTTKIVTQNKPKFLGGGKISK